MRHTPGSGKTTVARLYAQLLDELGVLKAKTASAGNAQQGQPQRQQQQAQQQQQQPAFVQETSGTDLNQNGLKLLKTQLAAIEANGGGVLFVDEAYALLGTGIGGQGREVTETD